MVVVVVVVVFVLVELVLAENIANRTNPAICFCSRKLIAGFIAFVHVVCLLEPISTPSSCTNYVDSGGFSFTPAHAPSTRNISQLVRIIRHHQNTTENIANWRNPAISFCSKNI
jgi:hypothetical protein